MRRIIYFLIKLFDRHKFLLLVILFSFLGTFSILKDGFYESHDGIIHTMRLAHLYEALKSGIFPVRWLSSWGAGYGSPVFNFIWPLPYYTGALLHFLGISFEDSIQVLLGLSLVGSAITCYIFLSEIVKDKFLVVVGSVLYVWAPYRFINVYIRGALGETLAFVFLPLVLWLVLKLKDNNLTLLGSVIWAGFILTHNISALIGMAIFLFYGMFLSFFINNRIRFFTRLIMGLIGGILLTAFYWLPAVADVDLVGLQNYLGGSFVMHGVPPGALLSTGWRYAYAWPTKLEVSMPFQFGNIQLVGWGISILFWLWSFFKIKKEKNLNWQWLFFSIMTFLFLVLVTPISVNLNKFIPWLGLVNYPWRFLGPATFTVAIAITLGLSLSVKISRFISLILMIVCILVYWPYSKIVSYTYTAPDEQYLSIIRTNTGFLPDNEFMPKTADFPNLLEERGEAIKYSLFESKNQENLNVINLNQDKLTFSANLNSDLTQEIRFQQFYFPGWQVEIDGRVTNIEPDKYGLITFNLPTGEHQVTVKFTDTIIRKWANYISLFSGIGLFLLWINRGIIRLRQVRIAKAKT